MALRLIEMILPEKSSNEVEELLREHSVLGVWQERLSEILVSLFFLDRYLLLNIVNQMPLNPFETKTGQACSIRTTASLKITMHPVMSSGLRGTAY